MSNIALPRELLYVMKNVDQTYRPLPWRSIMHVNTEIPAWATHAEVSKFSGAAEIVPVDDIAPSDLPRASVSRETEQYKLIEFGSGYRMFDREVERAQRMQVKPSTERAKATTRAAETLLDQTAATGDPYGIGLPGLLNNAAVTNTTSVVEGWFSATITADLILTDLHAFASSIHQVSKQTRMIDTMLFPVLTLDRLSEIRVPDTQLTVLELFKMQWAARNNGPMRMMAWDRLQALDGGDGRVVGGNLADSEVAEFLLPRDFTADQPRRIPRGWEVDQFLITGGVKVTDVSGLAYLDNTGATS